MTQKLFGLCAVSTLLFAFAVTNVASAEEATAPTACPCGCVHAVSPCPCAHPCGSPVAYRVGLFGAVRPVVYAPVYRPVHVVPRYAYPSCYSPCTPYRVCPPCYVW